MKILVVDDSIVSRKILVKKLESAGDCTEEKDSSSALEIFGRALKEGNPFDLVTLDASMPKMGGVELLKKMRQKEKAMEIDKKERAKIFMITAKSSIATVKACIENGCDRFFSKPVNKYQLLYDLSGMEFIPVEDIVKDEKETYPDIVSRVLKRFYNREITLPVMPHVVNEINLLMEKGDPSVEEMLSIIEKDILISGKLIMVANSSLYRGVEKINDLNSALVRLGVKATQGMISTLGTKTFFKSDNQQVNDLMGKLWMHSFACACLAKRITEALNIKQSETLFLMGVVHDIGKMLLIKTIADMYPEETFENPEMQAAIYEIHATFGGALLKRMNFTKEFIRVSEFHHWSDFSEEDDIELKIIHLSNYLANEIGFVFFPVEQHNNRGEFKNLENMESFKQLNLDKYTILEIAVETKKVIQNSADAL